MNWKTIKDWSKPIVWRFDYFARGAYRRKHITTSGCDSYEDARDTAIRRSRLNRSIVDLCIVEYAGQEVTA